MKVWLDQDEIRPGDLFVGALERGLEESKAVALIVSPEAMASGWVKEEYSAALNLANSKNQPLHLIPVILREAELPKFLASRNWVDFRDETSFDRSLERLIWGITGKRSIDMAQEPLKKRALLDRRLTTEIVALFFSSGGTVNIDSRTPRMLQFGLGLFEQLIVENVYGSALEIVVQREKEILGQAVTFFQQLDVRQENDEYIMAVEDASELWAGDPQFQLAVSRYDRLKGSNKGNTGENVTYLQHTLRLAKQLDAAILPHPDRWLLYRWWFEHCIWTTVDEIPSMTIIPLPEDPADLSLQIPQERRELLGQLASRIPNVEKHAMSIVRYGPMPYPFPIDLLRRYDREDLVSFEPFLYEFCVPVHNTLS